MSYQTKLVKIKKTNNIKKLLNEETIKFGAELLRKGELVAFPTETVYGLGADARREDAVKKIFEAKGRPQDNPLIVHISIDYNLESLLYSRPSTLAMKLIDSFWPGPMTLIFKKNNIIPDITTAGHATVALRMPSLPVAQALIMAAGIPIAAPSANSSGYPSPTRAIHVYNDLNKRIPYIIDAGSSQVGVESTVIDISGEEPLILRPGGITREEIKKRSGLELDTKIKLNEGEAPLAPGMKYRHYSPDTKLKIIDINDKDSYQEYYHKNAVIVLTDESANKILNEDNLKIVKMGSIYNMKQIAHNIFDILRRLDKVDIDIILVEKLPEKGLGEAIMNRLHKASS